MAETITNTVYKGVSYTPEQINMLREWALDCEWIEVEDMDIEERKEYFAALPDATILKSCDNSLEGGLADFDFTN